MTDDSLKIGSLTLRSRLFLGSAHYPDPATLTACIATSGAQIVTLAVRRLEISRTRTEDFSLLGMLKKLQVEILPNTAGCFTAHEAVLTAKLAREALQTARVKLEVIGDDHSLYPDGLELLSAARELVRDGFEVLPYCPDDVVLCQRLIDAGCVCVMPLASPIGSGRGLDNPHNLALIRKKIALPVVVDAGLGTASDVARVFELGLDAVLVNTAVARAGFPVLMARALREAALAGRNAFLARRIPVKDHASPSTTDIGKIEFHYMMKK